KHLFSYVADGGRISSVSSSDVNDALHRLVSPGASAKDFRTWGGTVVAAERLARSGALTGGADPTGLGSDGVVLDAVDAAAAALGNTRAVCRACYVHPAV